MPSNSFSSGIASNQASQSSNPTTPGSREVYIGNGDARDAGNGTYKVGMATYTDGQQAGDSVFRTSGSNGAGFYRAPTQQEGGLQIQQDATSQFRNNIPQMENQLGYQLSNTVNNSMGSSLNNVRQSNSGRGLLYGGVNAGNEGAARSTAAKQTAQGRSDINAGVNQAANSMDDAAVQTGVQIQQQQQSMQNSIYAQALASMNKSNATTSGLMQAGGAVTGGYLAGGL